MARMRSSWSLVLVTAGVVAVVGVATAMAQSSPSSPAAGRTLTVIGSGEAKPTPVNPKSSASIAKAVRDAEVAATPKAIGNGKGRAVRLAKLADMTLVDLKSVAETPSSPFGSIGPISIYGGPSPDRYCATVARPVYKRGSDGKRHRVGTRKVRHCNVPPQVTVTLTMTFTAT